MKNEQFLNWLHKHDACDSAINMVGDKTPQQVWDTWKKPTELLWWVEKSGVVSKQELTLLACGIVRNTPLADGRTVWDLLTAERSRNAIETAERWANGNATDEELQWAKMAATMPPTSPKMAAVRAAEAATMAAWADEDEAAARAAARSWQLAYIREQLPDFVERFERGAV
jgi:hypothetical protein